MHNLLHFVQERLATLVVELACLLAEEFVEVGVAAIGERAAGDGVRLQPCSGVAERAWACLTFLYCFSANDLM